MAVTPTRGKTHVRYCRFLANGYDLSGDMRAIGTFGTTYDLADATGWSGSTRQWLAGPGVVTLDGLNAIFNNDVTGVGPALAGSHLALSGATTVHSSVFIGVRAAPATGDETFSSTFEQGSYITTGGGNDPVMVSASYYGSATTALSMKVWGKALAVGAALSATGSGGSVDNTASSANGWIAFLHVTQTAAAQGSNNFSFLIEHGSNDSTWATLTTFTANGSSITAERKEGTGTVNRYVRFSYTRTAGTARPWVSFIRL